VVFVAGVECVVEAGAGEAMNNHHLATGLKRGGPAAPPDSVDFLPRVPKGPVVPSRRGNEDAEEKRERMEDPVAAGELSLIQCGAGASEGWWVGAWSAQWPSRLDAVRDLS
jgi:hypothetical protein